VTGSVILCSGQGRQSSTMFELVEDALAAQPVFAEARKKLNGSDPRELVRRASDTELHTNRTAQLLCCTQALAFWSALNDAVSGPVTVAGYSAGELSAWGVAGTMDIGTTFELVAARAEIMDKAAPSNTGLAAVLGLGRQAVSALCSKHGAYIAIINASDHFVIGGYLDALQATLDEASSIGAAHIRLLPVGLASHTPLLSDASETFQMALAKQSASINSPRVRRLLNGIDGEPVRAGDEGLRKLALQVTQTVDWAACMATCIATEPDCVLELGPGDGLATMFSQAAANLPVRSVAAFHSLSGIEQWVRGRTPGNV